jgi:hypothetical protein
LYCIVFVEKNSENAFFSHEMVELNMRAFFSLLIGQNPTPENHAKLHFTIGIPSGLRSAFYIKI